MGEVIQFSRQRADRSIVVHQTVQVPKEQERMPVREGKFDYNNIVARAMLYTLRVILQDIRDHGLPLSSSLLITFDVTQNGVSISNDLRDRFSSLMSILIDQWWENLAVYEDRFEITLNFSDVRERLVIPFSSVIEFSDPGANFGIRFS